MATNNVYIIAEAGVNHNGERDLAFSLIDIAADAGADAVKFQTFSAEKLASKNVAKAKYQQETTDSSENQLAMLKKLELPREWHVELKAYANKKGIEFLSTAFDVESLEFLVELGVPLFKVPSGELTNGPLLWKFARTRKPLILSTGMATLGEVEQALAIVAHAFQEEIEPLSINDVWRGWSRAEYRQSLYGKVSLLHCTSQYPTPMSEVNLRAMDTLANAFGLDVGYSDHTQGILVPLAAVARNAKIIEKHFTLNRNLPGPDHKASLEPNEFREMVRNIRDLERAMGDGIKVPQHSEWNTKAVARQQIVAARQIFKGSVITREDLTTARSGYGLLPVELWGLVGQVAARGYAAGDVIYK